MEKIFFYVASAAAGSAFVELWMVELGMNPMLGSHKSSLESSIALGVISIAFSCLYLITGKSRGD